MNRASASIMTLAAILFIGSASAFAAPNQGLPRYPSTNNRPVATFKVRVTETSYDSNGRYLGMRQYTLNREFSTRSAATEYGESLEGTRRAFNRKTVTTTWVHSSR